MIVDVAIVGGGPVGLTLANLLGLRGWTVVVLEKQTQIYPLPRAIHFDGEIMRTFQATGLAEMILPHTHVGKGMKFQDGQGNTLVDWPRTQAVGPMGWHESYRFYQPGLEAVLRDGLSRFDNVTLRVGTEVRTVSQDPERVLLSLTDGNHVEARFAVGADGTNSTTRSALGIDLIDLGFEERWLVADLILKRPRPDLGDHTIQICDVDSSGTYARGVGDRRRWELRLAQTDTKSVSDDLVWEKLARWVSSDDAELERAAEYTFRSRVADQWQSGRVFVAGDAAHQMPPFMGQGMCAGIRDAANLSWKLSAVLKGAGAELLATYGTERDANVRAFIDKSVALGRLINQTASGAVPQGQMKSIWPDLGPGIGERNGVGGTLAPQGQDAARMPADTAAKHGFYILTKDLVDAELPVATGANDWLDKRGIDGAIIRPDGYALGGFGSLQEMNALIGLAKALSP